MLFDVDFIFVLVLFFNFFFSIFLISYLLNLLKYKSLFKHLNSKEALGDKILMYSYMGNKKAKQAVFGSDLTFLIISLSGLIYRQFIYFLS